MSGTSASTSSRVIVPIRGIPSTIPARQVYISCTSQEVPCPEALGYTQGRTLGSGTYAKVKAAWSPYEGRMIAIKNLNKKQASKDYLTKFLPREVAILQKLSHPNIISTHQIVETELRCFFMLEIADNGDLLDYINTRRFLPEPEARHIFLQMSRAIAFCHERDIIHRDLKCENVMLNRNMDVKIGDFGFALELSKSVASTPCGSYSYAAPELFTANGDSYDGKKADVWSLGVILYAMVCGRLPFGDDAQVKRMQAASRQLVFSRPLSYECRGFLHSILNVDNTIRPDITKVLISEWPNQHPCISPKPIASNQPGKYKYMVENCLPNHLHRAKSRSSSGVSIKAPYPTTQVFGAATVYTKSNQSQGLSVTAVPASGSQRQHQQNAPGPSHERSSTGSAKSNHKKPLLKKIADAVKHVGHHKGHSSSRISTDS